MKVKKAITVKDVARKAGVSIGTVSRVLNRADEVAPELVEKTLAVIREMNYTPLRKSVRPVKMTEQERKPLGIFYFSSSAWRDSQVFNDYTHGVKTACREAGYDLMIYMRDDLTAEGFEQWRKRLSGVLVKGGFPVEGQELELVNRLAAAIPVVGLGMSLPLCRFPQVSFDNYAAGTLATEELIRRGHRHIAFVNPQPRHPMFITRSQGYTEAMKRYGLWRPELLVEKAVHDDSQGPETDFPVMDAVLDEVLKLKPKVTAVMMANDWNAGGLYLSCRRRGIRIPEDLSVVGFDNDIPLCGMMEPPLSSISNPLSQIGLMATRLLIGRIENRLDLSGNMASVHYLPGELIERGSIKKCKAK